MPLTPGAVDPAGNWLSSDCMARCIEDALPPMPPPPDPAQLVAVQRARRLFFIGLAAGIIEHLKAHGGDSFLVTLRPSGTGADVRIV